MRLLIHIAAAFELLGSGSRLVKFARMRARERACDGRTRNLRSDPAARCRVVDRGRLGRGILWRSCSA